jgi:small GTP-binding protein
VNSEHHVHLEGPLSHLREREIELLHTLAGLIESLDEEGPDDKHRLLDSAEDLRSMFFLLVVVGEFNAGKSTFINALLGDTLLPAGATPTTEAIEVIRYRRSKSRKPTSESGSIREWRHPNTGGEGVAIVDTPGSGSVFRQHEKTAKSFLHRADLVIFVLSAKRAFAETERLYLELAQSFGKKIILVINQADLLEEQERAEVEAFVRRQAKELLNLEPPLFVVSAKEALRRRKQGDGSGIEHVRNHLNRSFMQVPPAKQKLLAQLALAERLVAKYREVLSGRLRLVGDDEQQAEQVRMELEAQANQLYQQRDATIDEVVTVFENLRRRGKRFIDDNLRLSRLRHALDSGRLERQFEAKVVGQAAEAITTVANSYVNALVDGSRLYWRGVLDRLNRLEALVQQEVGTVDAGTYADQRAVLQEAILAAEAALKSYSDPATVEDLHAQFRGNLVGLATSTTVAVAGVLAVVLAAAPATAGALSGLGIVLGPLAFLAGGAAAALFWRRLTSDAEDELDLRIDELEATYRRALSDLTERERARLLQYGHQVLAPVLSQLRVLAERYRQQDETLVAFESEIGRLRHEIENAGQAP